MERVVGQCGCGTERDDRESRNYSLYSSLGGGTSKVHISPFHNRCGIIPIGGGLTPIAVELL